MDQNYLEAKTQILNRLGLLDASSTSQLNSETWIWFRSYLYKLSEEGWNRLSIHDLVADILKNEYSLSNRTLDQLYDFMTNIIGYCDSSSIMRFRGEPEGENELAAYVRGEKWRSI
jgi:hypothetical protein